MAFLRIVLGLYVYFFLNDIHNGLTFIRFATFIVLGLYVYFYQSG